MRDGKSAAEYREMGLYTYRQTETVALVFRSPFQRLPCFLVHESETGKRLLGAGSSLAPFLLPFFRISGLSQNTDCGIRVPSELMGRRGMEPGQTSDSEWQWLCGACIRPFIPVLCLLFPDCAAIS